MSNLKRIFSSFKVREELNTKVWTKIDGEVKMRPQIRQSLSNIADDFIEFLNVDIVVTDIIMTGSFTNYNWSEFSDVDLHIACDFFNIPKINYRCTKNYLV